MCGCKTTHDTSICLGDIPVVDRYNSSAFYTTAFGAVGVVHHFERAWSAGTDMLKTVPLRDLTRKHSGGGVTNCMKNVFKKLRVNPHMKKIHLLTV